MVTMKCSLAALVLTATTALAAPAPQADWCYILSQDCDNGAHWCYIKTYDCPGSKREAEAITKADAFCYRPGGECFKAKRAADALADSIAESGLQARAEDKDDGGSDKANLALSELAWLIALSKKDPESFYEALKLKDVDYGKYTTSTKQKREASGEEKRFFCYRPGTSCFKARRAAEAVLEAIEDDEGQDEDIVKRDEEAESQWFDCTRDGQPCAKAQRDLDSWKSVARNILETLVE